MGKFYEHLTIEERALILAKLETGCKVRAIARSLQRSPSTISRELKRCGWQSQAPVPNVRLRTRGINGHWVRSGPPPRLPAGRQAPYSLQAGSGPSPSP